jgi:outer membrane protein assembly factor BamE (lipoprotein component of BamABCDE complex)
MRNSITLITIVFLLAGCATAHKISQVKLGMTRDQVIETMGPPASTSAKGSTEYLNYSLSETDDQAFYSITKPYYVRLVDGRVDSYGRLGDFDSTQRPTVRIETDQSIKTQSDIETTGKKDLYSELMKLKQLRDEGLITQEEFEIEKKELLQKY